MAIILSPSLYLQAFALFTGNLLILTIADPKKKEMIRYLKSLPSRECMRDIFKDKRKVLKKKGKAVKNANRIVEHLGAKSKEK